MSLTTLYAKIPDLHCKGLCHAYCGPIPCSNEEWEAMGKPARLDNGSGMVILQHVEGGHCPLLSPNGRCTVYANRPLICRLWGVTKKLRCPHGCKPKRWVKPEESAAMIKELIKG